MLLISIAFSVLLIVGKEFKEEMSHVGMLWKTRYTETIVVCWQNLIQRDHVLETCVFISGSNLIGPMYVTGHHKYHVLPWLQKF